MTFKKFLPLFLTLSIAEFVPVHGEEASVGKGLEETSSTALSRTSILTEKESEQEYDVPVWLILSSGLGYVMGIAGLGLAYRSYLLQRKNKEREQGVVIPTEKQNPAISPAPDEVKAAPRVAQNELVKVETQLPSPAVKEEALVKEPVLKEPDKQKEKMIPGVYLNASISDGCRLKTLLPSDLNANGEFSEKSGAQPVIFILTDKVQTLVRISDVLSSDFQIRKAATEEMALEMIQHLSPQLIIYEMKENNEALRDLMEKLQRREDEERIPVVLCDWEERKPAIEKGFEAGAAAFWQLNGEGTVLKQLLVHLLKGYYLQVKEEEEKEELIKERKEKEQWLERARDYVEKNLNRDDLSVEELSRFMGISRVNLYQKLTAYTGETPIEFIRYIRLERAAILLKEGNNGIAEIAQMVGINNPKAFSRYFKKRYGVLPSVYQSAN